MERARRLAGLTMNRNSGGGMKKQGKPALVSVAVLSRGWVLRKSCNKTNLSNRVLR
jgi:hypothetical protein